MTESVSNSAYTGGRLNELQDELVSTREDKRRQLLEILTAGNPLGILALTALMYVGLDPNTFKESQSTRLPAHIEYLALQSLAIDFDTMGDSSRSETVASDAFRAMELVQEMFTLSPILYAIRTVDVEMEETDLQLAEYRVRSLMQSLFVRGEAYPQHRARVLDGCFGQLEDQCRALLGFTAREALTVAEHLQDLYGLRSDELAHEAGERTRQLHRELKRARRKGGSTDLPDWLVQLPPKKANHALRFLAFGTLDISDRILFSAAAVANATGLTTITAESILESFCSSSNDYREEHHAYPIGAHPLTTKPLLRYSNSYLAPVPQTIAPAIRPRMEDLIRTTSTSLWKQYTRQRAKYVEQESAQLLKSSLSGARSWTNLSWKGSSAEGELDGLVATDDLALHIQCKSGKISESTRRGAPERMVADLEKIIAEAAEQHQSLASALGSECSIELGLSNELADVFRAPLQVRVVVTLDDVVVWATQANKLKRIALLPMKPTVPWILSLTDLMVVVDMLRDTTLIHYLIRRQRLERDGRIEAHDELDWLGNYISQGLYFDNQLQGTDAPDQIALLTHSEMFDEWYWYESGARVVPTQKPKQEIPVALNRFINRLASERPKHWTLASVVLLEGSQEAREYWSKGVENIGRMLPIRGWSNVSVVVGNIGMTLCVDHRHSQPELLSMGQEYVSEKRRATEVETWIFVGEAEDGSLFIEVRDDRGAAALAEQLLSPPPRVGA